MQNDPTKAREIIMLCLGSAGVKIGHQAWEQYNWEHGLEANGKFALGDCLGETRDNVKSIYKRSFDGKYSPRALFWDFDPSATDELRTGRFANIYDPNFIIQGQEDAGGCFARAYYTLSREYHETVLESIRRLVEPCDNLQGFNIVRSLGGGTGSGIGALLLEKLSMHYGKKLNIEFNVFPSPRCNSGITDPYNVVLSQRNAMPLVDVAFLFENDALYNCCINQLDIAEPQYEHTNKIIAKVMTGVTGPFRFTGPGSMSMNEFQTNLVPLPRLHFPIAALTPIVPADRYQFNIQRDVSTLISDIFELRNQFVTNTRVSHSKYMAVTLLFRGNMSPNDVNKYSQKLKTKLRYVGWLAGGMKSSICEKQPFSLPGSDFGQTEMGLTGLLNTTSVAACWQRLCNNFDQMFKRKAFFHHYAMEGCQEIEFTEARENMQSLLDDYRDIEAETWEEWRTKEEICRQRKLQYEKSQLTPTVKGLKPIHSISSRTGTVPLSRSSLKPKLSKSKLSHATVRSVKPKSLATFSIVKTTAPSSLVHVSPSSVTNVKPFSPLVHIRDQVAFSNEEEGASPKPVEPKLVKSILKHRD